MTLISIETFSQLPEKNSPLIKLNDLEIKFNDIVIFVEKVDELLTFKDTANLYLDLGETIQGQIFQIIKSGLRDIKIEQQYETSLSISNEGPHLDLFDWKHFTSSWIELKPIDKDKYKAESYSSSEQEKFPDFTETELIDYLNSIGRQGYADLISNPTYSDGSKHWWIGLSRVSIKVTGLDKDNNLVSRFINFEISMGC